MFGIYFIIVTFAIGAFISLQDKSTGIGIMLGALFLATVNLGQISYKLILMKRGKSK